MRVGQIATRAGPRAVILCAAYALLPALNPAINLSARQFRHHGLVDLVATALADTGHTSLSYIKRFNVDALRLGRSFAVGTPLDPENATIATAVIALGHDLGLKVVAEGFESCEQAELLRALACDELQRYLLSRPLEAGPFAAWMTMRTVPASVA